MALTVIKEITLDMSSPSIGVVYAKQGDSSGRVVRALLTNNGELWSVPSDAYAVIRYRKSDNIGGFYDMDEYGNSAISYVTSSDRTKVDIVLSFQALSKEGTVYMELNFYTTPGIKLSTFRWNVIVEKGVLSDDEILSGGYYNILTEQINTAVESARQASTFVGAPFVVTSPNNMTDKSRVYVYAGSSTSSYTNGHWYFWNGSKWADGGPYSYDWQLIEVSDTQPTDEANRVWFKKTQSTISIPTMSEFNALEGLLTVPVSDASLWTQGAIKSSNGANNSSTTRLRTDGYYPVKYVDKVVAAEGYKVYVFIYSEANVASFVEPYTDGFVTGEVSLLDIDRSYYVRFVLANSSDSTITEEAGVNLTIYTAADTSLSLALAPAEAKATGDALAPKFSETTNYYINNYVLYNGKVYRFKNDHPAGSWVSGDVEAATVASAWRDLTPLALAQGNVPSIFGTTEAHIDLNDFTAPGNYKVTKTDNAKTIDNMPTSNPQAGRLIVLLASSGASVVQIYLMHTSSNPLIYVRNKTTSGWNPWERLLTTAYVDTELKQNSDNPISNRAVYEALNTLQVAEGTTW